MHIINTKFEGLKIIQQKKISDSRGNLRETFKKNIINWDNLIFDYAKFQRSFLPKIPKEISHLDQVFS